ncbi:MULTISPECIES: phage major capsid protein [Amycolatopsis]|uniref:phage major capsid protein n=1 Tax=Amycolatopsis TaxID=1813 RepID=UPI000B8AECDD|nr:MULTISPECIES: phage major capsid protein [Amycolatopsis]OXM73083.1 phage major capsid protein [Amycolatopsis sp. KNN50.9b]
MPNPYLVRLREQHDALRSSIEGLQTRAAEGNRDLTEDELRSVTEQATQLRTLSEQIEQLAEVETRSRRVGELASSLDGDAGEQQNLGGEQHRSRTTTRDRDPGHYRSEKDGGERSFFADHYRAKVLRDPEAQKRLDEHMRAVTQASGGAGIIPPKWLTDEYQGLARAKRLIADRVRHVSLGRDPRPLILPKQTAGTDQNITAQTTEGQNNAGWSADRFATDKDTLTPAAYSASQIVARQLIDASSPAADSLIMGDLRAAWDAKVESLVCAAILAGGTAVATPVDLTDEVAALDAVIDAQTEVAEDKRGSADLVALTPSQFGSFRKLRDTTNRPLMPVSRYNPSNATGALGNVLVGDIEGSDAYASMGFADNTKFAVLYSQAVYLAESDLLDFTYEQNVGPADVQMGIWGYVGVLVRNPGSVQVLTLATGA